MQQLQSFQIEIFIIHSINLKTERNTVGLKQTEQTPQMYSIKCHSQQLIRRTFTVSLSLIFP